MKLKSLSNKCVVYILFLNGHCFVQVCENPLHVAVRHCHAHVVEEILNYLTNERSLQETQLCVRQGNQVSFVNT